MAYNNILKARKSLIFAKNCDWCNKQIILSGEDSDPFVVNMEYKYFCIEQKPSQPAERDCMTNYLSNIKEKEQNAKRRQKTFFIFKSRKKSF